MNNFTTCPCQVFWSKNIHIICQIIIIFGLFRRSNLPTLGMSLLLTILIIAAGAGIALLFPKGNFQTIFILAISTLAIIASTNKRVRSMKRTFEAGTYLILVFSIAVASQVTVGMLGNIDPNIFLFITIATLGSLFMHVLLSALFRIDTDTTLATSISPRSGTSLPSSMRTIRLFDSGLPMEPALWSSGVLELMTGEHSDIP